MVRLSLKTSEEFLAVAGQMRRRDGVLALSVGLALLGVQFGRAHVCTSGMLTETWQYETVGRVVDVAELVLVVAILVVLRQGPRTIGIGRTDVRRATTGAVVALVGLVIWNVLLVLREGPVQLTSADNLPTVVGVYWFPAILEEVIFRGYITQRLQRLISSPALAQLVAVTLFVAGHLPGKLLGDPLYLAHLNADEVVWLVNLFLIGYVYDWLYRITGSVFPGIATHFLVNVTGAMLV